MEKNPLKYQMEKTLNQKISISWNLTQMRKTLKYQMKNINRLWSLVKTKFEPRKV